MPPIHNLRLNGFVFFVFFCGYFNEPHRTDQTQRGGLAEKWHVKNGAWIFTF
jgi:hypothetical protein